MTNRSNNPRDYVKPHKNINYMEGINDNQIDIFCTDIKTKKEFGIFFTPDFVVDLMVGLIDELDLIKNKTINILEPACGYAQFIHGIKRNKPAILSHATSTAIEINREIFNRLKDINSLQEIRFILCDYLLWDSNKKFDLIIGNPPYGIPSPSNHYSIRINNSIKHLYKKQYETWSGKYNVYGAFIEKSIRLLKTEGQLLFIVPATFMILDDFKKLRAFISKSGSLDIVYLGTEVFKPEADVSSVIIKIHRDREIGRLRIFTYQNDSMLLNKEISNWKGQIIKFETDFTKALLKKCNYKLGDFFDIRISSRTPEIKKNKLIINIRPDNEDDYYPVLNGRNLKCKKIIYENKTGFWIKKKDAYQLRGYSSEPHIVIGLGFRENGKVGAAIDDKCYPWMGDIYHLNRTYDLFKQDFDLSDSELVEYLNSDFLKRYVAETYREITYHLSITQIKEIPIPCKNEWKDLKIAINNISNELSGEK